MEANSISSSSIKVTWESPEELAGPTTFQVIAISKETLKVLMHVVYMYVINKKIITALSMDYSFNINLTVKKSD